MPIRVVYFKEDDGTVPVLDWITEQQEKVAVRCYVKIEYLEDVGHNAKRPDADYLRDKIYELRITLSGNKYRILYFFNGQTAIVLAHSLIKKTDKVPDRDIELAIKRKKTFESDPSKHTYDGESEEE